MTPAEIDRYTAEAYTRLNDASYKPAPTKGLNPYVAGPVVEQVGPITFVWAFAWTEQAKQQQLGWESLIQGFKLAMGKVYPDCSLAHVPFDTPNSRHIPLAFAQIYAKMRRTLRGDIVFIEPDVVPLKRCNPFESDMDIGLCDGADQWPMMPFNPGVMFVKDTPGAQRYLDTAMEYALHIPQNTDHWYCYQYALSHAYLALRDKINIKVFPHAQYNYAPTVFAPTDAYFVHLKGDRKRMQRDYVLPLLEQVEAPKLVVAR